MSDSDKEEPKGDDLPGEDWLPDALPLVGDALGDGGGEDPPELPEERMEALLDLIGERIGGRGEESAQAVRDVLILSILDGTANQEQRRTHEEELENPEYLEQFRKMEEMDGLLSGALPLALSGKEEEEAAPFPENYMKELLAGVRKKFGQGKETVQEDTTETSFWRQVVPLAAAAVLLFAFVQFYGGGGDADGQAEVAQVIEFGDWEDDDVFRGGNAEGNGTAGIPPWVELVNYDSRDERRKWLDRGISGKKVVKVWLDRDSGLIMIHRPGAKEPEKVEVSPEEDERTQILAILKKLREETEATP